MTVDALTSPVLAYAGDEFWRRFRCVFDELENLAVAAFFPFVSTHASPLND